MLNHTQAAGKVVVTGDPAFDPLVYIVVTDNADPNAANALFFFAGEVPLDATCNIDAGNAGLTRLKTDTYIYVYASLNGPLLQSILFHTSCSQPLAVGNQFGSALLISYTPE